MTAKRIYPTLRFQPEDFVLIRQLVTELSDERKRKVFNNQAVIDAVLFYLKYRKLVEK